MADDSDESTSIRFTVSNARSVDSRAVFALVDVTVEVAGVEIGILGIQARREANAQTSVRLPTFKDANGSWQPAICRRS